MQQQILEEHPHSDLKVYVVWFDMLSGDSRQGWDGYLVPDPRATNLWDKKRLVSRTLGDDERDVPTSRNLPMFMGFVFEVLTGKEDPGPLYE